MSVTLAGNGTIELRDVCTVEDADTLLQFLLAEPDAEVNWQGCESIHLAVLQVLLAAKATPLGSPESAFLRDQVAPTLRRGRE